MSPFQQSPQIFPKGSSYVTRRWRQSQLIWRCRASRAGPVVWILNSALAFIAGAFMVRAETLCAI